MKILVVDDDLEMRGLIAFTLRQAGYLALEAADGAQALALVGAELPDLVILDVNLPGMDGFEVCRRLRAQGRVAIMLLTVRNAEEDHVHGLDEGADDYLTKPFSPRTLLARVRALLRRVAPDEQGLAADVLGAIALDGERQTVSVAGARAVRLTRLEFRLMQYLLANHGRPQPFERVIEHVWGYRGVGDRQLLKQLVHRLRQKVERDPAEPEYVVTVPGVGYVLESDGGSDGAH